MSLDDADRVYGFDEDVARTLKAMAGVENPELGQASLGRSAGLIVQTPGGGIPKRSGTTVTVVGCSVWRLTGTGSTRTLSQVTGLTVPVGNMSASDDVAGNAYVLPTWAGGCLMANSFASTSTSTSTFDVRVKSDGTALQKSTDGGTTWTDWATIGSCPT